MMAFLQLRSLPATCLALLLATALVDGQLTQLYMYPLGGTVTSGTQAVPIGSTIVFACQIPSLTGSSSSFTLASAELHAWISSVDTVICAGATSGNCIGNSQGGTFQSRSITISVSQSTVGVNFTITNAVLSDSLSYYCKMSSTSVLYSPASPNGTQLQVYSLPLAPVITFGGSSVTKFVAGSVLPQLQCSANVGAPNGWLQVVTSGHIGASNALPFSTYLTLASNTTEALSNGSYLMTYRFNYASSSTYTLTASDNSDTFTCIAYNWAYSALGSSSAMVSTTASIQVQYAVTSITVTTSSTLSSYMVQSGTTYTLTVVQGTYIVLNCNAGGNPSPAFVWTKTSGLNQPTMNSVMVAGTMSVVDILVLVCTASNNVTAGSSPSFTSLTATVRVIVNATAVSSAATTVAVATASIDSGTIAGIVIGCVAGVALIVFIIVCCVRCPPGGKHPSKSQQPLQAASQNGQASRGLIYEPEDKKQPLSVISEMDIPYAEGAFDDTPRSRKPIVDPHAQSAAEYIDSSAAVNDGLTENGGQAYVEAATPNGNLSSVPPTYPGGTSTLPNANVYEAQNYGNMNPYGVYGDGGYNAGTMA